MYNGAMLSDIVRVLIPATATFMIGMVITPILTHYLYTYRVWKKIPGKTALDGTAATEFNRLHTENEMRAPRMGGIVVWASVAITTFGAAGLALLFPTPATEGLNFLSRS